MTTSAGHTLPVVIINKILQYKSQMEDSWWYINYCDRTGRGRICVWETHPAWKAIHNVCKHKLSHPPTKRKIQLHRISTVINGGEYNGMVWILPRYRQDDYIYQPSIVSANHGQYTVYLLDECPASEYSVRATISNDTEHIYTYNRGTVYYNRKKEGCIRVFYKQSGALEIAGFSTPANVISARMWCGVVWIHDDVLNKWRQL